MANENFEMGPQTMNFVESIKTCLGKYVDFSGRASRAEYWWFFLFSFIIGLIPVVNFLSILLIVPTLSVSWRRMHDIGKSGWFLIIPLYNLYLWAQPGQKEANKWGNPVE